MEINRKHYIEGVDVVHSPNKGRRITPQVIVLHDTAGRLEAHGSISWLTNRKSKVSAHLVVARNGKVTQLVPFDVAAWHAGRSAYKGRRHVNNFGIGIEIVNPGLMKAISDDHGISGGRAWYKEDFLIKDGHDVKWSETPEHGGGVWMHYTDEQMSVLKEICIALTDKYNIKDVTTHYAISPKRKVDVNPLFPIHSFREAVGFKQEMGRA